MNNLYVLLISLFLILSATFYIYAHMDIYENAERGDILMINIIHFFNKTFVDMPYKSGLVPMHYAAIGGHVDVIEHLLKWGHSIDIYDNYYHTPMHSAAAYNNTMFVVKLLEKGSQSINIVDAFNCTPVHYMLEYNNVDELIKYIENINVENSVSTLLINNIHHIHNNLNYTICKIPIYKFNFKVPFNV